MTPTVENVKLLASLLAILKKENNKTKDELYEQLYSAMQQDFDKSTGVKYLQVDGIEEAVPIQVFRGSDGEKGALGSQGVKGETGSHGLEGQRGEQGGKGDVGRVGPQGLHGVKGEQGKTGPHGEAGKDAEEFDSTKIETKFTKLYDDFIKKISSQITRMAYARGHDVFARNIGGGVVRLELLDDIDRNTVSYASDGQVLVWSAAKQKWEANTVTVSGYTTTTDFNLFVANTNAYIGETGFTGSSWNNANDTITFYRPNLDTHFLNITGFVPGGTHAQNTYVNSTFAQNTYVNSTFAQNTYVNNIFTPYTYVDTNFALVTGGNNYSFGVTTITELILTTVLGTEYGGTGLTSFVTNGVLYASNSSTLAAATGTFGDVMQVNAGGIPIFDNVDGGSF